MDIDNENEVLKKYEYLIYIKTQKYKNKSYYEDLLQECRLAIILAYRKFDSTKNCQLKTFIEYMIDYSIYNYFKKYNSLIHIPRPEWENKEKQKLSCFTFSEVLENDEDPLIENLTNNIYPGNNDYLNQKEFEYICNKIISKLPAKYINILKEKYFNNKSLSEIADIYNIKRQRVHELLKYIYRKIRQELYKDKIYVDWNNR